MSLARNIGAFVVAAASVLPQSSGAAAINGTSIDRAAHGTPLSAVLHQTAGAISGAPTTSSVQSKLQHSPDNSTWADYLDPSTGAAAQTAALTAQNTANSVAADLATADRYLRVVTTVGFTGGTSPAALVTAGLVLGGEPLNPAI